MYTPILQPVSLSQLPSLHPLHATAVTTLSPVITYMLFFYIKYLLEKIHITFRDVAWILSFFAVYVNIAHRCLNI